MIILRMKQNKVERNAEIKKREKAIVKHLKRLKEIWMHDAAGINLNFHFYSY